MIKLKRYHLILAVPLLALGVGALFQNCSEMGFAPAAMSVDLPIDHPSISGTATAAQSKLLIGDQRFLESAFREAFLFEDSAQNERDFLEAVFVQEFRAEQHLLARGCDPMEIGDGSTCNGNLGNAQISLQAQTSAGREAARLQVCRRVVANDTMTARLIKHVSGGDTTPTATSLEAIVRLFYPNMDEEPVSEAVTRLSELDLAMAKGSELIKDRWKILFLTVCESSGWEAL